MTIMGFKPLYRQVEDALKERLLARRWRPGDLLPSEIFLAEELKVSQGTVRKALDEMVAQNLLVRRQGRGTYVAQHDHQRSLFHFFKLVAADGEHRLPTSRVLAVSVGRANQVEAEALGLSREEKVTRIDRVRSLDDIPIIVERVSVADARFPGLRNMSELPNTLYAFFNEHFDMTITSAREEIRAIVLDEAQARHLRLDPGAPALEIKRIAVAIDGQPVELRISAVNTALCKYVSDLR